MNDVVIAIIGSGILSTIISGIFGLVNRKLDAKEKPIEERFQALDGKLKKEEKDSVRTQLLLLMSDYPDSSNEILEVARHYFVDIKGDWYMTSLFDRWLEKEGQGEPEWFQPKEA